MDVIYELHATGLLADLHQLVVAVVLDAVRDVLFDCAREENGVLPYEANLLSDGLNTDIFAVGVVEVDAAQLRFVEAFDLLYYGRLSRTALAYECYVLSFLYVKV